MNIVDHKTHRKIEPECEVCEEKVALEIPEGMFIYRVGTGGAARPMRSDFRTDEIVLEKCSKGHEIGVLLISASRNDLPEPLKKRKKLIEENGRVEQNRSLDEF